MNKCDPVPYSEPDKSFEYGAKVQCACGRVYVVRHGDGMRTPPRRYWKLKRRFHIRRYSFHLN